MKQSSFFMRLVPGLLLLALAGTTFACGVSTHTEVAHRAISYFSNPEYKAIIQRNQDAFQAGNPYPDSFYGSYCYNASFASVSEDTHWGKFMVFALDHVRTNFPKPWDAHTEKLVAFLLGIASHGVADTAWHGHLCGVGNGWMDAMGCANFGCVDEAAHSVADPGGDVVLNYDVELGYMGTLGTWYVPSEDMAKLYAGFYAGSSQKFPTAAQITECSRVLYLARLGEKIAMSKVMPAYGVKSPFLLDMYYKFPLGGVNDMALWTSIYWKSIVHQLDNGVNSCTQYSNPICTSACFNETSFPANINCGPAVSGPSTATANRMASAAPLRARPHNILQDGREVLENKSLFVLKTSERGVTLLPSKQALDARAAALAGSSAEAPLLARAEADSAAAADVHVHESRLPFAARTAASPHAMAVAKKLNLGGLFGPKKLNVDVASVLSSKTEYSAFSESVASADINGDGYADIISGAPHYGFGDSAHSGRVYIVLGRASAPANSAVEDSADVIIEAQDPMQRFGSSLAIVDVNGDGVSDLAVGAPASGLLGLQYLGKVYVFLGTGQHGFAATPSIVISATDPNSHLGSVLAGGDFDGDGHADLAIGAPFACHTGSQSGAVYVFTSNGKNRACLESASCALTVGDADFSQQGEGDACWLGHSLKIVPKATQDGRSLLLAGAPYCRSSGVVYAIAYDATNPPTLFTLTGTDAKSQTGAALAVGWPYGSSGGLYLAVSSPSQNVTGTALKMSRTWSNAGIVSVFRLGDLSGALTLATAKTAAVLRGDRVSARYGGALAFGDLDADGSDELIVTAPRRSQDPTGRFDELHYGQVYVYAGGLKFVSGDAAVQACHWYSLSTPCPDNAAAVTVKSDAGAQFGSSLLPLDFNKDGKLDLVVGGILGSRSARNAGQLALLISSMQ